MSVERRGTAKGDDRRRLTRVLAVVFVVVLGVLLLWPDGFALNRGVVQVYVFFLNRGMPRSVTPEDYAVLLNVVAFAVLGMLGVLLLRRRPAVVAVALVALSVAVELIQALPGVARDPSLLDVVCNAAGAVVGVSLASLLHRRRGRGGHATGDQAGIDQAGDEGGDVGGERLGR